jgi:hypothetical protein
MKDFIPSVTRGINSIQINVPKYIGTMADEKSFVSICK